MASGRNSDRPPLLLLQKLMTSDPDNATTVNNDVSRVTSANEDQESEENKSAKREEYTKDSNVETQNNGAYKTSKGNNEFNKRRRQRRQQHHDVRFDDSVTVNDGKDGIIIDKNDKQGKSLYDDSLIIDCSRERSSTGETCINTDDEVKQSLTGDPKTDISNDNRTRLHYHKERPGSDTSYSDKPENGRMSRKGRFRRDDLTGSERPRHPLLDANNEPYVYVNEDDISELSSSASSQISPGKRGRTRHRYRLCPSDNGVDILERKYQELQRLTDDSFMHRQEELRRQHAQQTKLLYREYVQVSGQENTPYSQGSSTTLINIKDNNNSRQSQNEFVQMPSHIPSLTKSDHAPRRPKSAFIRISDSKTHNASLTIHNRSRSAEKYLDRRNRSCSAESLPRQGVDPTDHQLKLSKNDKIIDWLKQKNVQLRIKKKEDRTRKRAEYQERIMSANERLERRLESQKIVKEWMEQKRKETLRLERESRAKYPPLNNPEHKSKMFMVLASCDGTKVCDSDRGRCESVTLPPTPGANRRVQMQRVMHGYKKKNTEPVSSTGVTASGKYLNSRPRSAKSCDADTGMCGRKSYDQWLVDKRKENALNYHKRKQNAIKMILAPDNSSGTSRASRDSVLQRENSNVVARSCQSEKDLLTSSLTRDEIIHSSKVPVHAKSTTLVNKQLRKKKQEKRSGHDIFVSKVAFPVDEGCPKHVAKVQEKHFSHYNWKSDRERPEPQGSDGKPGTCPKGIDKNTLNDNVKLRNATTTPEVEMHQTVEYAVETVLSKKIDFSDAADVFQSNNVGDSSINDQSTLSWNSSDSESEDLERQTKIAIELENTLFRVASDEELAENGVENGASRRDSTSRRVSVDKHVVFSEDAPEVKEYEQIELESDPDDDVDYCEGDAECSYDDDILEFISVNNLSSLPQNDTLENSDDSSISDDSSSKIKANKGTSDCQKTPNGILRKTDARSVSDATEDFMLKIEGMSIKQTVETRFDDS